MKKIISLFLALVMCLSLCACGGEKEASVMNTEAVETTLTVVETEPVIVETEPVIVETEPPIIELTIDNWDEYLEFKPFIITYEDAFGDFGGVSDFGDGIWLKEEYFGRFGDFAVEIEYGAPVIYRIEYNIVTKEISVIEQNEFTYDDIRPSLGSGREIPEGGTCISQIMGDAGVIGNHWSIDYNGYTGENGKLEEDIYIFYAPMASSYKMLRVQGTIK